MLHFIIPFYHWKGEGERQDRRSQSVWFCMLDYKEFSLVQVQSEYQSSFGRRSGFPKKKKGKIGVRFWANHSRCDVGRKCGEVWACGQEAPGTPDRSQGRFLQRGPKQMAFLTRVSDWRVGLTSRDHSPDVYSKIKRVTVYRHRSPFCHGPAGGHCVSTPWNPERNFRIGESSIAFHLKTQRPTISWPCRPLCQKKTLLKESDKWEYLFNFELCNNNSNIYWVLTKYQALFTLYNP